MGDKVNENNTHNRLSQGWDGCLGRLAQPSHINSNSFLHFHKFYPCDGISTTVAQAYFYSFSFAL
eukprot:COSAG01_NODE_31887_length_589_cov_14.710204_1_plen_64_part_10